MSAIQIDKARTIGGSDVAAVLGISPFRTRLDVWREKVLGQRDTVDTPATRAGTRFEPHILAAYREQLPAGSTMETLPTVLDGYRRASVDAIANVRGWRRVVEAKSTVFAGDWGGADTDQVPLHYVVQGTWYADILGCDEIDYPVLLWPYDMRDLLGLTPAEIVAHCDLPVLRVQYSARLAASIRSHVDAFWAEHVLPEIPPPAVDLEDIKRLHLIARGKSIPADEELVRMLVERDRIRAEERDLEARAKANAFAIRAKLGDAECAIGPGGDPLVTCKLIEKAEHVVKPMKYRQVRTTKHWKELNKP
jgi:hypothetical protein